MFDDAEEDILYLDNQFDQGNVRRDLENKLKALNLDDSKADNKDVEGSKNFSFDPPLYLQRYAKVNYFCFLLLYSFQRKSLGRDV